MMIDEKKLQEIYAWIDGQREKIIEELSEVASIKSVSDASSEVKPFGQGCLDVLNLMLDKGQKAGFETHNYDNYVGSIFYDTGAKEENTIGVWAHLDVVPEGEGWLSDPYSPVLRDGLLFGRGVGDNKSAAIGTFYIQQALRACNVPMKHNLKLFLGTSEETGMADVSYYVSKYPVPKFSLVPDAGFPGACGEFGRVQYDLVSKKTLSDDIVALSAGSVFNIIPNKATVTIKKKAELDLSVIPSEGYTICEDETTVTIEAAGVSRHAAGPEGAVNAVYQLTKVLAVLPGLCEEDRNIFQFLTDVNQNSYGTYLGFAKTDEVSGQTVSSGTVLRMKDGIVRMTNDCRHCVTDTNERIIEQIEKTSNMHDFSVEIISRSKPYYIDKNDTKIQTITKVYKAFTGLDGEVRIGKGGTYAGKIPNAVATGIVVHGDYKAPDYLASGHGGAHQPDEFIPIEQYIEGIKLLTTIILNLDEVM